MRVSNLLKTCSESFSVTLVAPQPDGPVQHLPKEMCAEFIAVEKDLRPTSPQNFFINFVRGFYDIHSNARSRYRAAIDKVRLDDFDLIWVERRSQFACVRSHAKKIILDLDDVEHKKLWKEILVTKWSLLKIQIIPRLLAIFLWEIFMTRFMRAVVVCSDADKEHLERFHLKNVRAVPNGTSIDVAGSISGGQKKPSKAVFLGNMEYPPNFDAIQYFDREIITRLLSKDPAFSLDVVGRKPADVSGLSEKINFLGYVDDVPSTLQNYAVMVVPLRFGGGTKQKVLDAMASGVPLVTTSIGAEGINIENNIHAMIADTPEDFAVHVTSLLENPSLGNNLRANAHKLAMQSFAWKTIRLNTAAWLSQMAG